MTYTWTQMAGVKKTMKPIALDSKEEYLAWVIHWKERYKWISAEIRGIRKEYGAGRTILSPIAHEWHMMRLEGKRESWLKRCECLENASQLENA